MKIIYRSIGILSLGLGTLGAFLTLLPTTCFVLLAAWCFAKSSPQWHNRLRRNRLFGRSLVHWEHHRCISIRVKTIASISMLLSVGYSLLLIDSLVIRLVISSLMLAGLAGIWTLKTCQVDFAKHR